MSFWQKHITAVATGGGGGREAQLELTDALSLTLDLAFLFLLVGGRCPQRKDKGRRAACSLVNDQGIGANFAATMVLQSLRSGFSI